MGTWRPSLYHAFPVGVVLPAPEGLIPIVTWYWVVHCAVSVIGAFIVTEPEALKPV